MNSTVLTEQIAYYRARATEYDEWFLRKGRYDWGAEQNAKWFTEVELARAALQEIGPVENALELACGTGLWTVELAKFARHITAVDAAPEMLELNHQRMASAAVSRLQADLFTWEPPRTYDLVMFSFWLSHVPHDQIDSFLAMVSRATRPGGKVFLVDSLNERTSMAKDHDRPAEESGIRLRKLKDGREFHVVKLFHDPAELSAHFSRHGFQAQFRASPTFFLYGVATRI